jgi:DNA-binding response OmpR family regulator
MPEQFSEDKVNCATTACIIEFVKQAQAAISDEGALNSYMMPAVLLIDDNAVQAATRQAILRRSGYSAIAVLNPKRALEQLRGQDFPMPIGLIITDHLMPEMSGATFVKELRRTDAGMPVMVISGLDEARSEYAGMNVEFLLKPLHPEHLLEHVHELLRPVVQASRAQSSFVR